MTSTQGGPKRRPQRNRSARPLAPEPRTGPSDAVELRISETESLAEDVVLVVEPSVRRWETGTRAYIAEVTRDLFGQLILRCTNAGTGKRHYQERTMACGEDDIRRALILLGRVRRAHAYTVVEVTRPC